MNKEEAIKFLRQLYPNGGHCWLDYQRMEAIRMAINALQEEPANDDLKKAAENYAFTMSGEDEVLKYNAFIEGAQWQKEHSWKPADGDDMKD
jgi:hypothetical protein